LNCSLSDRKPVDADDEVVVMIIPDHQMLESVERISSQLADDPVCNLCLIKFSKSADSSALVYSKENTLHFNYPWQSW
jgi:hypothetical protein